jgi:hypothetical protein
VPFGAKMHGARLVRGRPADTSARRDGPGNPVA